MGNCPAKGLKPAKCLSFQGFMSTLNRHSANLVTSAMAPGFSVVSRLVSKIGVCRPFLLEYLYRYSTVSNASHPQPHFLLDYLISSLGFSKEEAIVTTKRLRDVRYFRRNPDLVVNYLLNLGLRKGQVKSVVSVEPRILSYNVDKTLVPKIRVLLDVGLSGPDLVKVFMRFKSILAKPNTKPTLDYLRNLIGSDELVATLIKKCSSVLDPRTPRIIASNVELLQKIGFSREGIVRLMMRIPSCFLRKPEFFQGIADRVENDFGISQQSKMFYHGVIALSSISDSKLDMKFQIFRSFGWSDATIYGMLGRCPYIFLGSEDKIRKTWNFFVKELGYPSDYLAFYPVIVKMNFEKRVKPRTEVLEILKAKKLTRKLCLYAALSSSESKFLNNYLLPYKDEIPDVYDSYFRIVGGEKAENL